MLVLKKTQPEGGPHDEAQRNFLVILMAARTVGPFGLDVGILRL
jgi:hypothetical protein